MSDEVPQSGQPISLEHPFPKPEDQGKMLDMATTLVTNRKIVDDAQAELKLDKDAAVNISDPGLASQVEAAKFDKLQKDTSGQLGRDEVNLQRYEKVQDELGFWGKLGEAVNKVFDPNETLESKTTKLRARVEEVKQNLYDQEEKASAIQEFIVEDDDLFKKTVERAYDEAQIVQRMALGFAIKEVVGKGVITNEVIERYVSLYNRGEMKIEERHYEKGLDTYDHLVRVLRLDMFGELTNNARQVNSAAYFYNPRAQVGEAKYR